jgi:hypothetical protein
MINNTSDQDPTLDTITRITPTMRADASSRSDDHSVDMCRAAQMRGTVDLTVFLA